MKSVTTDKVNIKDLSRPGLGDELEAIGGEPYRVRQIFRWLYGSGVGSFDEMTDIPATLRRRLDAGFRISSLEVLDLKVSPADGTTKYLFALEDANTIESVLLPEGERGTICLSSQAGCKFACAFCASATAGFARNLSQGEILNEAIFIKNANPAARITNLVFMGIGEPFDNYDNVLGAIRIFNDKDAFGIGARKITISTCGLIPGIKKLAREGLQIELSVSLHSASDSVRSRLLPVNKRYPLDKLIAACRDYADTTNRIVTFEYVLIDGVNSSAEDAARLAGLVKGVKCKVNVISYNKVSGSPYREPSAGGIRIFMKALKDSGVNATHRKPKGEAIDAGCGQLRLKKKVLGEEQ